MNYIELNMEFTANGQSVITWLVFEFHTRDEDGVALYNGKLFPNLKSGDEFPCNAPSTGAFIPAATQRLVCVYYEGDTVG